MKHRTLTLYDYPDAEVLQIHVYYKIVDDSEGHSVGETFLDILHSDLDPITDEALNCDELSELSPEATTSGQAAHYPITWDDNVPTPPDDEGSPEAV